MQIITYCCPECNTVVAANELEANRIMKCPGLDCENVLRFDQLSKSNKKYFLKYCEQYQI